MTLKYIWRSFQPRLSFLRPFQQSLACFRVARSPSNSWASCKYLLGTRQCLAELVCVQTSCLNKWFWIWILQKYNHQLLNLISVALQYNYNASDNLAQFRTTIWSLYENQLDSFWRLECPMTCLGAYDDNQIKYEEKSLNKSKWITKVSLVSDRSVFLLLSLDALQTGR